MATLLNPLGINPFAVYSLYVGCLKIYYYYYYYYYY